MFQTKFIALACVVIFSSCLQKQTTSETARTNPGADVIKAALPERSFVQLGQPEEVDLKNENVSGFRIQSFGNSSFRVLVTKSDQNGSLTVYLEGPLTNDGDTTPVGKGPLKITYKVPPTSKSFQGEVDVPVAGAYRLVVVPDTGSTGKATIAAECLKSCEQTSISSVDFIKQFVGNTQKRAFVTGLVNAYISANVSDAKTATKLHQLWEENLDAVDHGRPVASEFPKVSMKELAHARAVFGKSEQFKVDAGIDNAHKDMNGKPIDEILGKCAGIRQSPAIVDSQFPDLKRGEDSDLSLTACEAHHSPKVAKILNALAEGQFRKTAGAGESLTVVGPNNEQIQNPEQFFKMLLDTGHRASVQNVRQYANFLAMVVGDLAVRWPIWVNSQVKLSNGEELEVPFSHSEHVWIVQGPKYNFRVRYFLGTDGIGFVPLTTIRPAWSGGRIEYTLNSETDALKILQTVKFASAYYSRIKLESKLADGKFMRTDGYGILGVCNDSNTILEFATRGTVSTYPLLRSAEFQNSTTRPKIDDGLETILAKIPQDADLVLGQTPTPAALKDVKRRIVQSSPLSPVLLEKFFTKKLRTQIELAQRESGAQ